MLPRWLQNVFSQVSGLQPDSKTLMQVKQSFAYYSARIGLWKGQGKGGPSLNSWSHPKSPVSHHVTR
jgi:hypothetical protein